MQNFEETIGWILHDFKLGTINFSQATLKIEEAIVSQLGINLYLFSKFAEMNDYIKKLECK